MAWEIHQVSWNQLSQLCPLQKLSAPHNPLASRVRWVAEKAWVSPDQKSWKHAWVINSCFQHKTSPHTYAYEENSLQPRLSQHSGRIPIPLHSWLQNTFAVFNNLFILTFSSLCFWFLHSDIRHTEKADSFPHTPSKFVSGMDQPPCLGLWQLSTRQETS